MQMLAKKIMVIAVLFTLCFSAVVDASYFSDRGCREYTLHLDAYNHLNIMAGSETFYTWQNIGSIGAIDLYVSVYPTGRPLVLGKFIKVSGETTEIQFASSNENVATHVDSGHFYIIRAGETTLSILVKGDRVDIPLKVVALPFPTFASVMDIISSIGLPDSVTKTFIPWPESKLVDDIFYYKRDDGTGQRVHHWMYDAYPGLILSIDDTKKTIKEVYNRSWEVAYNEWLKNQ